MSESELNDPAVLKGPDRERLAAAAGQTPEDVARMIHYFQQTKIVATWMYMRKSNGEKLPQNESEMVTMQEGDVRLREIANQV
jgi:signal recognition particle GTPase